MTTEDQAIAPTSADYAMGYAEGFNDTCKPPAPDCRTCEYMWIDVDLEKATSKESCARFCGAVCINGSLHKPAPKVVLWRTT